MAFPVFHEFDADGTIRTNGLHWEGFPRLAWEALSAAGYLTPPTLLTLAEPLDVTQMPARYLNVVFTLQGLRYNITAIIGQRLEASRRDWQQLSAAHQQLNFTLTQVQQENDRLRARRFQLELERGDRL
jgi:hypothetical protein